MEQMLVPIPWQTYSDERNHYSYVRCLSLAMAYEVVRVTHDKHGEPVTFLEARNNRMTWMDSSQTKTGLPL